MNIEINLTPYKQTFEGHVNQDNKLFTFELDVFKSSDWQITWLESDPTTGEKLENLEDKIHTNYLKHKSHDIH